MPAFRRTTTVGTTLLAGLLLVTGCQSTPDSSAEPLPSEPASSTTLAETTSPTPSTSPSPTTPAWQTKYSKKQIAAYKVALDRFATYEQRAEPIWRRGKATPAAQELFQDYFYTWTSQFRRLQTYEQANVEIHGAPTVLRSRPTRIAVSPTKGDSVTIWQCVDFTTSVLMQNDQPARGASKKPAIRTVVLSRSASGDRSPFRVTTVTTTERRCSG